MVNETIFETLEIDRGKVKWENYLNAKTPVQYVGNMYFKRDDYFAPLGYGAINGGKLRQCIFIINGYYENKIKTVYSGASVLSPQIPMSAAVCYHYGIKSINVVGATKPQVVLKNDMMRLATYFGAELDFIKVGYNPVLQRRVKALLDATPESGELKYGIAVDSDDDNSKIETFHSLSGNQTMNMPSYIKDLVVPTGSCNSAISILYGLQQYMNKPENEERKLNVHLIGIGPKKVRYINERLLMLSTYTKLNCLNLDVATPHFYPFFPMPNNPKIRLYYYDLHTTKYVTYSQRMPYNYHGIKLHPTYEGKVMTYLMDKLPYLEKDSTMFWIVGSEPDLNKVPEKAFKQITTEPRIYNAL